MSLASPLWRAQIPTFRAIHRHLTPRPAAAHRKSFGAIIISIMIHEVRVSMPGTRLPLRALVRPLLATPRRDIKPASYIGFGRSRRDSRHPSTPPSVGVRHQCYRDHGTTVRRDPAPLRTAAARELA